MTEWALLAAAVAVLVSGALALWRVVRAGHVADRIMSVQLMSTSVIASLLLVGAAVEVPGASDLALVLAMLAPVAAVGLAGARPIDSRPDRPGGSP